MPRIIATDQPEPTPGFGAARWRVRALPYDNAATKFWSSLLDETLADFPPASEITVSASTSGWLTPELLAPERALQRDLEAIADEDTRRAYEDALSTLTAIGPPPLATLRIQAPTDPEPRVEKTLDVLDAEVVPFLLVWLFEWACVPEALWNEPSVGGRFVADDPDRRLRYRVTFKAGSQHLSEGLFQRRVAMTFDRESLPRARPPAKSNDEG